MGPKFEQTKGRNHKYKVSTAKRASSQRVAHRLVANIDRDGIDALPRA